MKTKISVLLAFAFTSLVAQNGEQLNSYQQQFQNLTNIESGLTIGGYGEVTYNDPDEGSSELDVQRLVMLFVYKFDDRVSFITEIEYEHVKEVYIEQAWLNYALNDNTNLRAGLLLVPMGIVNEYHEPTTYKAVARPTLDNTIVPTTWRDIGIAVSGRLNNLNMRYQSYMMNGPQS
nr:hypothetical protein [Pelagibacterales bacterium]